MLFIVAGIKKSVVNGNVSCIMETANRMKKEQDEV